MRYTRYGQIINVERSFRSVADLCLTVEELSLTGQSQSRIGDLIGRTQSYVCKLLLIVRKLESALFIDWKERGCNVDVLTMIGVAKLPLEEQREAYEAWLQSDKKWRLARPQAHKPQPRMDRRLRVIRKELRAMAEVLEQGIEEGAREMLLQCVERAAKAASL